MEIYVKLSFISIFSFCYLWLSNMILADALILPIGLSQLQAQQVMTLLIRSHIAYLMQTLYSCAHFVVEINEKYGGF